MGGLDAVGGISSVKGISMAGQRECASESASERV